MTEANIVEGYIEKVTWEETLIAIKSMTSRKAAGTSVVCAEMISASGKMRIRVMIGT